MQVLLILTILGQIYGVFSIGNNLQTTNDSTLTVEEINATTQIISKAVDEAVKNVSAWIDSELDDRLNLLIELQRFHYDLLLIEFELASFNDCMTTVARIVSFSQQHINRINELATILIPTIKDFTGTYAITSCLRLIQITEPALDSFRSVLSS